MERLTNELHGDSKIYLLTLEIANLKRLSEMLREAIQAKCTDCCSVIAEKYFHMEQFCRRCPLIKYREKEVKNDR